MDQFEQDLLGRAVLVIEDEWLVASETSRLLQRRGAVVVGPAGRVRDAVALIDGCEQLDAALLDIDLRGDTVYPIVDRLRARGIPLAFVTGYAQAAVAPRYRDVPCYGKPFDAHAVVRDLLDVRRSSGGVESAWSGPARSAYKRRGHGRGLMAAPATIYGIKNCDTMKKARAWLESRGVDHIFHDYKASGVDRDRLEAWEREVGWELLLNRSGTTFRALPETDRQGLGPAKAIALMLAQPSMIKRPVLDTGRGLIVGFKPERYEAAFG